MVQTRHQWNTWANRGFRNTQSSQGSQSYQNEFSQAGSEQYTRDNDMYNDNDHCHRHRKPDSDPKTVVVSTYNRRKPR